MKTLDEFMQELKVLQQMGNGTFAVEMQDGSEPTVELAEGSPNEDPVIVID